MKIYRFNEDETEMVNRAFVPGAFILRVMILGVLIPRGIDH